MKKSYKGVEIEKKNFMKKFKIEKTNLMKEKSNFVEYSIGCFSFTLVTYINNNKLKINRTVALSWFSCVLHEGYIFTRGKNVYPR